MHSHTASPSPVDTETASGPSDLNGVIRSEEGAPAQQPGESPGAINRAFPNEVFAQRRRRVIEAMQAAGGGIAIIAAAATQKRSRDSDFPYRQDSDFFYLSGFTEPDAVLILDSRTAGGNAAETTLTDPVAEAVHVDQAAHVAEAAHVDQAGHVDQAVHAEPALHADRTDPADRPNPSAIPSSILFCRPKDPEREVWEGFHHGPAGAQQTFGFDAAWPNGERDAQLALLLDGAPALFYPLYAGTPLDQDVPRWITGLRRQRGSRAPAAIHDLAPVVEAMRSVKDRHELERMRTAAQISAEAHRRAMRAVRPGMPEYALEAELLYEFRRHGAQAPAYTSIVAGGGNACILHYPAGDKVLQDGELVLIDAACELDGYAADITRTFPVNGRFSGPQRTLYDIVLEANRVAAQATRPGARFDDAHQAALRVLVQGMLDTGLLSKNEHGGVEDVIENRAYTRFYMHRTGHWLGMDVHDCGNYEEPEQTSQLDQTDASVFQGKSRILRPGMVTTIEPGLYVRRAGDIPADFWDIGIRIEDNAVITPTGCELITRSVPVDADEIEYLMQDGQ